MLAAYALRGSSGASSPIVAVTSSSLHAGQRGSNRPARRSSSLRAAGRTRTSARTQGEDPLGPTARTPHRTAELRRRARVPRLDALTRPHLTSYDVAPATDRQVSSICLIGHTDKLGDTAVNAKLARERAQAVAADLVHAGYPANHIVIAADPEAFGDMSLEESLRSLELFAREVMPAFARVPADAAQ